MIVKRSSSVNESDDFSAIPKIKRAMKNLPVNQKDPNVKLQKSVTKSFSSDLKSRLKHSKSNFGLSTASSSSFMANTNKLSNNLTKKTDDYIDYLPETTKMISEKEYENTS